MRAGRRQGFPTPVAEATSPSEEGYRAESPLQHYRTIQALPLIIGSNRKKDADYLENCRKKRNIVEYDCVGSASKEDVEELLDFVKELRQDVIDWLKKQHSHLLNP